MLPSAHYKDVGVRIASFRSSIAHPTYSYERASYEASDYDHWMIDRVYLLVPAQAFVGQFLMTFKDFPPRQKAASFSLDQVMQKLQEGIRENN
jgi:hypothetical protein